MDTLLIECKESEWERRTLLVEGVRGGGGSEEFHYVEKQCRGCEGGESDGERYQVGK